MAINVQPGRWGLSLIIEESPRAFTTSALLNRIASGGSECHYPPLNATKTGYTFPYALVYCRGTVANDANTFLIPRNIDTTGTIGDLNNPQRTAVRNFLTSNFTGYTYTDWDGTVVNVPAFNFDAYPLTTLLVDLIRAIFSYLGNSDYRPRPAPFETHNTEYTDDFSTDPASRWTQELANPYTWDSGTNDFDSASGYGDTGQRYSANGPGSIEHEAQVTHTGGTDRSMGPAVRFANDGTDDLYAVQAMSDTNLTLWRWNGATRTYLADPDTITTYTSGHWYTIRLAASGGSGSNVVLDVWCQEHGSSTKPSDPGWYGVDGTPGGTYTDTSVDRLDDGSLHLHCGIGGRDGGSTSTGDFFKLRAISDRGGGGVSGTIAVTLSDFTSSASGAATTVGTIAQTLGSFTSSISGLLPQEGTMAAVLGSFTSAISGTKTIVGTIAVTLSNFTSNMSGTVSGIVSSSTWAVKQIGMAITNAVSRLVVATRRNRNNS